MIANTKLSAGQLEPQGFTGWASYTELAVITQTITSTPSKLRIDTNLLIRESQLPSDAVNSLWNSSTNKITPISLEDSYDVRISFVVQSKISTPTKLSYVLDQGTTSGITNNIYESSVPIDKTAPYKEGFTFPIFCSTNFLANNGQIFLFTDTGSIEISNQHILIIRTHKGR